MRRILVVAFVILGGALIGDAQEFKKDRTSPPFSTFHADRFEDVNGDAHFAGNVSILFAGGTVTADSAIIRHGAQTIELEGHVQLKVNVPPK
jgi:lipopolysaccharide assembly outer membrane protein LptD (OstA)